MPPPDLVDENGEVKRGPEPILKIDLKNQIIGPLKYSTCHICDPVLTVERLSADESQTIDYYISITFRLWIGAKPRSKDHRDDYHQRYLRSINLDHVWATGGIHTTPEQYPKQDDEPTFQVTAEGNKTASAELGATGSVPNFSVFLSHSKKTSVQSVLKGWDYTTPPDDTKVKWIWKTNYRTARKNTEKRVAGTLQTFERHVMLRRRITVHSGKEEQTNYAVSSSSSSTAPKDKDNPREGASNESEGLHRSRGDPLSAINQTLNTQFGFEIKVGVNERKGPINALFRQLCTFGRLARDREFTEVHPFTLAKESFSNPLSALINHQLPTGETIDLPETLKAMTRAVYQTHGNRQSLTFAAVTDSPEINATVVNMSSQRE